VVFGGLIGAILWNLMTWLAGLPSSSSHALFGGLIGATWIAAGTGAVHFDKVLEKIIVPAVASPLIAGVVALVGTFIVYRLTRRIRHDVVKRDYLPSGSSPPFWVILTAALAISAGTYLGGWRIIQTVGHKITDVESPQGFAAESSAATVILASSHLGYALSTTHVASGAVISSGAGKRLAEVHWGVAGRMAVAWVLTLPAAAVVGALAGKVAASGTLGLVVVAVLGVAVAAASYVASRRNPVDAGNVNDRNAPSPVATPANA
jgi:inorganic phosphate transporter, PiT family